MFGRKKEKKRHKHGMTQDEISKLEEVGIRRGFFSKITSKRDKEDSVQKRDISRPLSLQIQDGDNKEEGASVLQRATMYGQVVNSQRRSSVTSPSPISHIPTFDLPPTTAMQQNVENTPRYPVPPFRRKVSTKSSKTKPHYDTPKAPTAARPQEAYSAPRTWSQPVKEARIVDAKQQAPFPTGKAPRHRLVVLKKRAAGDFGVSLRRSAVIEHVNNQEIKRTVHFAEPGHSMLSDIDQNDDQGSRLYPGDRLIEIDGVNVENVSRDEIVAKIKSAGKQVTFLVQSMQEVDEVSLVDSQESQYSIPRRADGHALDNRNKNRASAKDDDIPKLPAAKRKERKEDAIPEKCHLKRQKSCDDIVNTAHAQSSNSLRQASTRSLSVCAGIVLDKQDCKLLTTQVTPSELHASSMLSDPTCEATSLRQESEESEGMMNTSAVENVTQFLSSKSPNENAQVVTNGVVGDRDKEVEAKCSEIAIEGSELVNETRQKATAPAEVNDSVFKAVAQLNLSEDAKEVKSETLEIEESEISVEEKQHSVVPKQEIPKPHILPEVIHLPKQPGVVWKAKEKVWYRTKDGISEAHIVVPDIAVEEVPEGKSRIEIFQSKELVMVPEDDVEMANEAQFDRVGDLTKLRHLNESSMLHTLSQRQEGTLTYSFAGPHLVSVRLPYQHPAGANIYSEKMKQTYKGSRFGDTPPHLYAIAQHAYHGMMTSSTDQSIMSLGLTASGKSSNTERLLSYFATVGGHSNAKLSADKLMSVVHMFESFSSSATKHCKNASRCVHIYNLDFDRTGQLAAMSVQALLLERSRLVKRADGEANFNVFYQLLHGADTQLRRELFLLDLEQEGNPLIKSDFSSDAIFHQMAVKGFAALQKSFDTLSFSQNEVKAVYAVLAACLHLGLAGSQKVNGSRYQFARADSAQKASSLLGFPAENLAKLIFQSASPGKRLRATSTASLKRSNSGLSSASNLAHQEEDGKDLGQQALDAFIIGLYTEVYRCVVSIINRALSSSQRVKNTILVVDAPGYQGWDSQMSSQPASYADLTFNYVQDRLHALFHFNAFSLHKDRYQQEGLDCEVVSPENNFVPAVDVVDQPPAIGGTGVKGLLWLLDEEAASPGATDETFIERLLLHYSNPQQTASSVVERSPNQGRFILRHQAGACAVEYDASGWLRYAYYNSTVSGALEVLQDSKKKYLIEFFGSGGEKLHGSVAGLKLDAGGSNLKRASSFRKAWSSSTGAAAAVKKSMCMLTKFQTDGLVDMLRRAQPHFILSLSPHSPRNDSQPQAVTFDIAFVRQQLRGFQLLSAARTLKQGYPEHIVFSDFRRRFDVLLRQLNSNLPSNSTTIALLEDREATENVIKEVELSRSQYKMGVSQVFFRSGVMNILEDKRNEKISNVMVAFQARCRGYLARKRYERKKVQVVAIRCIQRNIRKFMAIRLWPWWRLLTKVLPLVEVTRTEEELREKQAELDLITEKFERVQSERDDLKSSSAKSEMKLQEVMLLLEDERTTSGHASELLEHERKERLRMEKLLKDMQASYGDLQGRAEAMEVELAEKRLMYSEHTRLDSDEEAEDGEYKARYEKAVREFNFQNKKKSQEHEDSLEELRASKKSVDRKLAQLQEELDDQHRIENSNRKKLHKLNAELNDAKIHLEETMVKNHELEKKQRKFDSELYAVQANVTELKSARDRVQREKDKILLEKKDLEKEVDDKAEDIETLTHKIRRLEDELEDTDRKDTDDRQAVNSLKKQIRELEAKVKDQEEELEEQASTIHTLEHNKERLEMAAEHARQQRQREVDGKDEELEEMRSSYIKKIKQLELQVEEADEERASMSKHKRDLEHELKAAREETPRGDVDMEKRLRRDLKRYKALLADAQTMIDHLKADVVSKQQMRQLKAQVEDLQYTSSTAVKSRKTIELEVEDLQAQLEEISKSKQEAESRVSGLQREVHELNSKLEEDAEDAQETVRKYRQLVHQQTEDKRLLVEAEANVEEAKHERSLLEEKILTLQSQVQYLEENTSDNATVKRLESKAKDLETKLEFQKTTTRRLEVQLARAKENNDKLVSERDSHIASEHREKEAFKRVQRQLREAKDEQADLLKREQEALQKRHDLEMEVSEHENQIESLQSDLKLAFKRISDLQISLEELEESDMDEDDDDMSSSDEDYSPRLGWRSRLSTSGYSARAKTRSSIASSRLDNDDSLSDKIDSTSSYSFKYRPSDRSSGDSPFNGKTKSGPKISDVLDASPIEDSMSDYGRKVADSVITAASTRKKKKMSNGSVLSLSSREENGSDVVSLRHEPLDRVSKTLANENPSLLLYGKPSNIAVNLGLGKARSFHALNESLRAVKSRQNLPESRRRELQLRDKVNSDIEKMKLNKQPRYERSASALDFRQDENEERDFDTHSVKEYEYRSYSDIEDDEFDRPRPPSVIRRGRTNNMYNVSPTKPSSRSPGERNVAVSPVQSDTDLILRRHEFLQRERNKPFTSRFLQNAKHRHEGPSLSPSNKVLPGHAYHRFEGYDEDDSIECFDDPTSFYPPKSDSSPSDNWNNHQAHVVQKRLSRNVPNRPRPQRGEWLKQNLVDFCDDSDPDNMLDEDDISLSRFGVNDSPDSHSKLKQTMQRRARPRQMTRIPARGVDGAKGAAPLTSRSLSRGREGFHRQRQVSYNSDCDDVNTLLDDIDLSIPDKGDPLDSIIRKYLYRKTYSSDEDSLHDASARNGSVFSNADGLS